MDKTGCTCPSFAKLEPDLQTSEEEGGGGELVLELSRTEGVSGSTPLCAATRRSSSFAWFRGATI